MLYTGFSMKLHFRIYMLYNIAFLLRFYLFLCQGERVSRHKQGEWQAEREPGPPLSKEPSVGLDPKTLGE